MLADLILAGITWPLLVILTLHLAKGVTHA